MFSVEMQKAAITRLDSFDDEKSEEIKEFNVRPRPDDEMRGSLSLDIDIVEFMKDPQTYPEVF